MVSFWPWRGDDTSPASFEKSLSTISKRISTANAKLETSRQQSRRFKALWTLYTSIAYLIYSMIIGLVVGLRNSGMVELGGLVGGPLLIYGVRKTIASFYAYRTSTQQTYLESLQKQRDSIIAKLKEATKYDSTQMLLEKYGGTPAKPKKTTSTTKPSSEEKGSINPRNGRTMMIPPPTANIPRGPLTAPDPSQNRPNAVPGPQPPLTASAAVSPWPQQDTITTPLDESAEFAPNAFPSNYYAKPGAEYDGGRWYDRFMDLLLGEDESHPKNRIVLICKKCRLVNGQAPPGVKSLTDVGKWRCSSCGAMNGEESEMQKIVAEIENEHGSPSSKTEDVKGMQETTDLAHEDDSESDVAQDSAGDARVVSTGRETRSAKARKSRKHDDHE